MSVPASVSFSGPAFSFLLYENNKSRFLQQGFLLGEIIQKETKTITDNDQQQIHLSNTIKINSILPCPQKHFFYNGIGNIDKNKLKEFLGNQFGKVVAWYKFQNIPSFKFLLRDRLIHKQLINLFDIPPDQFTCCFLNTDVSDNRSTHLFSQVFMRYNNNKYECLPIHIPNLSESNNKYKSPEPTSQTFNNIIAELKIDTKKTQGLVIVSKIESALQKHIDKVIKDLSVSEQYLHELEKEVMILESKKLKKKKNEEKSEDESFDNSSQKYTYLEDNSKNEITNSFSEELSDDHNIGGKINPKTRGRGKSSRKTRGGKT